MIQSVLCPWTADTFPRLDDTEFDVLCVYADAGGPLCLDDVCDSAGISDPTDAIEALHVHGLIDKCLSPGVMQISALGMMYLECQPPKGVEL